MPPVNGRTLQGVFLFVNEKINGIIRINKIIRKLFLLLFE